MRPDPGSDPEGGRDPDAQPSVLDLGLEALFTAAYADGSFERVEHPRHLAEEAEALRMSELCQSSNVCYECA